MINDRFNVVSLGKKNNGAKDGVIINQLSQTFKIKQKQAIKLLKTKNKIIKKGVDWETAEAYYKKLTKAGLAADIDITMTRELFLESLEEKKSERNNTSQEIKIVPKTKYKITKNKERNSSPAHNTAKTKLVASTQSSPNNKKHSINSDDLLNTNNYLKTKGPNRSIVYLTYASIAGLAAFAANFFLSNQMQQTFSNSTATAASIIFVPIAAICFPAIMGIRRLINFTAADNHRADFPHRHTVAQNQHAAKPVYISQSRFIVKRFKQYTSKGELLYRSSPYINLKDIGMFIAQNLRKRSYNNDFTQIVSAFWHGLTKQKIQKNTYGKMLKNEITPRLITNNTDNEPVAFLYRKKNAYIEITAKKSSPLSISSILMLSLLGISAGS